MAIDYVARQSRRLLSWMHFDIQYKYSRPDLFANGKKYFMVCNHMSYMDILCLSAGEPTVFVTSVELRESPFLGQCAELGGSYFVERRVRSKIPGEIKDLARLMQDGFHIFVFPEATSHHGMSLLPFKKSMFTAAIEAGAEILPVCLRYEEIDGEPFNEGNHDRICWYEKMAFAPHFLRMTRVRSLKASIEYLEPISSREFPDRAVLAEKAYAQISKAYFSNRHPSFKPKSILSKTNATKTEGHHS